MAKTTAISAPGTFPTIAYFFKNLLSQKIKNNNEKIPTIKEPGRIPFIA